MGLTIVYICKSFETVKAAQGTVYVSLTYQCLFCSSFGPLIIRLNSFCFRLSCRSREAQVVAASQRTPGRRERARKPKASLNPQRLLNARKQNLQSHTQVRTAVRHTFNLLSNVCDQKHTYLLFSCRCCDDFLKLWRGGRCERENHRDRKTQASGSFPQIISSHKFFFSTHQVDAPHRTNHCTFLLFFPFASVLTPHPERCTGAGCRSLFS